MLYNSAMPYLEVVLKKLVEAEDIIHSDLSMGGHLMNVAKDSEAEKMHLLSLKLRFVLTKVSSTLNSSLL